MVVQVARNVDKRGRLCPPVCICHLWINSFHWSWPDIINDPHITTLAECRKPYVQSSGANHFFVQLKYFSDCGLIIVELNQIDMINEIQFN